MNTWMNALWLYNMFMDNGACYRMIDMIYLPISKHGVIFSTLSSGMASCISSEPTSDEFFFFPSAFQ